MVQGEDCGCPGEGLMPSSLRCDSPWISNRVPRGKTKPGEAVIRDTGPAGSVTGHLDGFLSRTPPERHSPRTSQLACFSGDKECDKPLPRCWQAKIHRARLLLAGLSLVLPWEAGSSTQGPRPTATRPRLANLRFFIRGGIL